MALSFLDELHNSFKPQLYHLQNVDNTLQGLNDPISIKCLTLWLVPRKRPVVETAMVNGGGGDMEVVGDSDGGSGGW